MGCKEIHIRKSEFVAKTQFLSKVLQKYQVNIWISFLRNIFFTNILSNTHLIAKSSYIFSKRKKGLLGSPMRIPRFTCIISLKNKTKNVATEIFMNKELFESEA